MSPLLLISKDGISLLNTIQQSIVIIIHALLNRSAAKRKSSDSHISHTPIGKLHESSLTFCIPADYGSANSKYRGTYPPAFWSSSNQESLLPYPHSPRIPANRLHGEHPFHT